MKNSSFNDENNKKVEEAEHIIATLKTMKVRLERDRKQKENDLVKFKALGYICGGAFLAINTIVGLCFPPAFGISLLVSGALFGSIAINEVVDCHVMKKKIKDLDNKIDFFRYEINDAVYNLEEIKKNNTNSEIKNTRHEITKIYKKEELFEEFKKNENKLIGLERKKLLDKYLTKKGYNQNEIEIFNEFVRNENSRRTNEINTKIEEQHRSLSKANKNNIGLYFK